MTSLKGLGSKKVLKERSQHGTVVQAFPALQQGGGIEHPRLKVWFEILRPACPASFITKMFW